MNLQPLDMFGEPCRGRTDNLLIKSYALLIIPLLFQLFNTPKNDSLPLLPKCQEGTT